MFLLEIFIECLSVSQVLIEIYILSHKLMISNPKYLIIIFSSFSQRIMNIGSHHSLELRCARSISRQRSKDCASEVANTFSQPDWDDVLYILNHCFQRLNSKTV